MTAIPHNGHLEVAPGAVDFDQQDSGLEAMCLEYFSRCKSSSEWPELFPSYPCHRHIQCVIIPARAQHLKCGFALRVSPNLSFGI